MSDWQNDEDLKPENNVTFKRISSAIGCSAGVASEAWLKLGLDFLDDPNELRGVREAVSIYGSAAKHAQRVYNLLSGLPHAELERLAISQDTIITGSLESLKKLSGELEVLYQHRRSVVQRNKSNGGKDPRADAIAEMVAWIFIKMGKEITFGQMDDEPTTDYCRAVKEVLVICDNKRHSPEELSPYTNWRNPAQKAFNRYRGNAN